MSDELALFGNISEARAGDVIHLCNDVITLRIEGLEELPGAPQPHNCRGRQWAVRGVQYRSTYKRDAECAVTSAFDTEPRAFMLGTEIPFLFVRRVPRT